MGIPKQTFTYIDPGLGITEPVDTRPLFMGVSASGVVGTLKTFSKASDAQTYLGQGPLTEAVCTALALAGGPVYAMRLTGDAAAANSAVAKTAVGASTGTITVAGTAYDAYSVRVNITLTGTLGTARFRYSLDNTESYSDEYVVPAGGTFVLPSTGLTLTFVPGAGAIFFQTGDYHTFTSTPNHFDAAALTAGIAALRATTTHPDFIVLAGRPASSAAGATLMGALTTGLANLLADFRPMRAIMDTGTDNAATSITSYAALTDARICKCFNTATFASAKPIEGRSKPAFPLAHMVAALATRELISTDLARVATGALPSVDAIGHDEYLTEVLDVHRFTTARTWLGRQGFYLTNARLSCPAGSDYLYWQFGRIMDVASRIVYTAQQDFISIGVRTNADGTIDERDALRLEGKVDAALRQALTQPTNAEGTQGHVSDLAYRIDRTNNLQLSQELLSDVAIRPLGYPKFITTTLSFRLAV